jgi:CRISPR/Cas system CSM-associated protein Csm4 (group 5 of RAMP superfamily)
MIINKNAQPSYLVLNLCYYKKYNKRWFLFDMSDESRKIENMTLETIHHYTLLERQCLKMIS